MTAIELAAAKLSAAQAAQNKPFASRWSECRDAVWLGAEYWANPLQDWRLAAGRIECIHAAADRNVHLLTRQLGPDAGNLQMSVRVGRLGATALRQGAGSVGFRIGVQGPLKECRNNLIYGTGLDAGINADGRLFIGNLQSNDASAIPLTAESVELQLSAEPRGARYSLILRALDPQTGRELAMVNRTDIPGDQVVGNLALVANFGGAQPGKAGKAKAKAKAAGGAGFGQFWFADWKVEGSKLEAHDEQAFGPILFSQYTQSGGVMKLTAQMAPIGPQESQTVRLQLAGQGAADWSTAAEAKIHPQARTATFRIENWNATTDVPYRVAYTGSATNGAETEHYWTGVIRRDPVDQPVLTVADISCNIHAAFPNAGYVANMGKLNPDLLAFVGDQFYESTGGYGVIRGPLDPAILDYLRKWYIHGWTWRDLTRDRPSVSLPDDHDVYQGNIWGEGGAPQEGTQEMGGYNMPPDWVNVVHRTQASHHPDPHGAAPIKQGISVYYGPLTYGRVSFAIIADRMFKTAPQGVVPPTGSRGDHVVDPNFDPKTADLPGAELLGERQMKFLREWAADWRGADMKALISQTIFTAMATTHGGGRERLRADYDANGWPQTARNAALREIRKAFAVHLAGDQHLPAIVQYGIDQHRDGPVAFAGPAVNVGYPRWWEPEQPGKNRKPGAPENTGDFLDHFGNPMTVIAVANGAIEPTGAVLQQMQEKASGLGLVRFDKVGRTVTFECWPYLADPTIPGTQFPGWPVTVQIANNDGRQAAAHLPMLEVAGIANPVVQVLNEADGEILYTLRISGRRFQPKVFAPGTYTVRIGEPELNRMREIRGIVAQADNQERLQVQV
jgi:alkaline phosphatase D